MNRGQQAFGLGQPPTPQGGRFGPARGASGSIPPIPPTSPSSYPRSASHAFPFGAPSALSPSAGPGAALPEANLDPSDFPALGSGPASSAAPTSNSTPSLFSYASQAGQPAPTQPPSNGAPLASGMPASALLAGAATAQQQREFSADDFPALGGYGPAQVQGQPQPGLAVGGTPDLAGLVQGVNGMSLAGRTAAGPGQEQASALAALQAQQQHRASLLGAMNGGGPRTPSGAGIGSQADKAALSAKQSSLPSAQQPWAASPSPAPSSIPSSLLSNGNSAAASSPLPPSAPSQPHTIAAEQQRMRSPTLSGVSALAQTPRSASSAASNAVLPPPPNPNSNPNSQGGGGVPQTPAQQVLFSPADRFGLLGLLHIIKTADPDVGMLALGNDLTNLGLDLGAPDHLYSSFITPWSDSKAASMLNIEPEFHLPSCYNVQPPPANTKIGNFSDETLFFIFYSQPRDAMQEMAAHELYKHNWRYHKELRLWLTKEAGTEPTQKTATYERGSYIFFDPVLWERVRREFVLIFGDLEARRA
ncbi:hypothetical protein JCM1840_001469 [Sporobolomyces johnsonii]